MSDNYGVVISAPSTNFDVSVKQNTIPNSTSLGHKDVSTNEIYKLVSDSLASFNTFTNEELKQANDFVIEQYESATSFIDFEDITDSLVKFYYSTSDTPYLGIGEYLALSRFKPITKLKKPIEFIYDTFIKKSNDENYIQYVIRKAGVNDLLREISEFLADIVDVINPIIDMERNESGEIVAVRSDGFEMKKDGEDLIATILINSIGLLGFGNSVKKIEDEILNDSESTINTNPNDTTTNSESVIIDKSISDTTTISIPNNKFLLTTKPSNDLTIENKKDLLDYGTATNLAISKRDTAMNIAQNDFNIAKQQTDKYLNKYNDVVARSAGYADPTPHIREAYWDYIRKLNEQNSKAPKVNETRKKSNNQRRKRHNDTLRLLDELVKTCLSADNIHKIVTDTFNDVLTLDSKEIIQEHIDRNKKYTKCCLLLNCKPCEYTDKKYYDDESGKGN